MAEIQGLIPANQQVPTKFGRFFYYWTIDVKHPITERKGKKRDGEGEGGEGKEGGRGEEEKERERNQRKREMKGRVNWGGGEE